MYEKCFSIFYFYNKFLLFKRIYVWICFSFWEEQNIRFYATNHLLRLIELFVTKESLVLNILFYLSKFCVLLKHASNIIRLRVIFRLEEIVVSLVQLHGHLFCLTTGLQYFIKTYFETEEKGHSFLVRLTAPKSGSQLPSQGHSSLVRVTAP